MDRQTIEHQSLILANQSVNPQTRILTLDAPLIARTAQPGQFVNLACDRFLRRPIGMMQADPDAGTIKVGIRIQGDGTRWLADRRPGDQLSVLGPLGHGFDFTGVRRVITVGGGTGVFPLFFVQQYCCARQIDSIAVCGYRSRADSILADDYAGLSCRTLFASDCGDMDVAGHAAVALEQLLSGMPAADGTVIMTCGPKIMMQAVAEIAVRYHLPCQVSLEERMACGIGVCLVCACKIKAEGSGQPFTHQRCCVEGPVFPAEVVEWST